MILRLSKLASSLTDGVRLSDMPGVMPSPAKPDAPVQNGTEGRLAGGAAPSATVTQAQGPRAYAPRLNKV